MLGGASGKTIFWCFFFGLLWGIGGLTFGLTMRYLGLSLGMAIVMGLCAAFGTLMPPIFNGTFVTQVLGNHFRARHSVRHRRVSCGNCDCGPGRNSQREIHAMQEQKAAIEEFNLRRGFPSLFSRA